MRVYWSTPIVGVGLEDLLARQERVRLALEPLKLVSPLDGCAYRKGDDPCAPTSVMEGTMSFPSVFDDSSKVFKAMFSRDLRDCSRCDAVLLDLWADVPAVGCAAEAGYAAASGVPVVACTGPVSVHPFVGHLATAVFDGDDSLERAGLFLLAFLRG